MKGYYKLKPGQTIRDGDVLQSLRDGEDFAPAAHSVGQTCRAEFPAYRKARFDGCPPGWRNADKGEMTKHQLRPNSPTSVNGVDTAPSAGLAMSDGSGLELAWVMPWPEDPRQEAKRCPGLYSCQNAETPPHTCPFQEDVHGDSGDICTCCENCTQQCADDI